jgi:hypothetical protein
MVVLTFSLLRLMIWQGESSSRKFMKEASFEIGMRLSQAQFTSD